MDANNTGEPDVKRNTEDIRHDIAKEKENISRTVEEIGERIKEKLDWREYVKDYPYVALGAAVGLGYVASGIFIRHATPMEQIMRSITGEARHSLDSLRAGATGPGLIKMTLLSIAAKAAASWIKNVNATAMAGRDAVPPQTGSSSSVSPRADA